MRLPLLRLLLRILKLLYRSLLALSLTLLELITLCSTFQNHIQSYPLLFTYLDGNSGPFVIDGELPLVNVTAELVGRGTRAECVTDKRVTSLRYTKEYFMLAL